MWKYHSTCYLEPATETEEAHPWVGAEPEVSEAPAPPEPRTAVATTSAVRRDGPRRDDLAVFGLLEDRAIARPASLRTLAEFSGGRSLGAIGLFEAGRSLSSASPRELLGMLGLWG